MPANPSYVPRRSQGGVDYIHQETRDSKVILSGEKQLSFPVVVKTEDGVAEADAPSDEQISAVLLHLRFFFVQNEPTSLLNIHHAYDALTLTPELQGKFKIAHSKWEQWASAPSKVGGKTNFQFFKIMVYGEPVHRNKKEIYGEYDEWQKNALLGVFTQAGLCLSIWEMVECIQDVYYLNLDVLAYLGSDRSEVAVKW